MQSMQVLERVKHATTTLDSNVINPMAYLLRPVQNMLGEALLHLRAAQRVLTWQDPPVRSDRSKPRATRNTRCSKRRVP